MLMFRWQSDDRTRRYFRNPAKPTLEEHLAWFELRLEDPSGRLCVIQYERTPAGVLRLDPLPTEGHFEVSLLTDPALYRHGVGVAALLLARAWVPRATIHAEVLPGNEASRRMVLAAGYLETRLGHFVSLPIGQPSHEPTALTQDELMLIMKKVDLRADASWMDQPIEDTPLDSLALMELRSAIEVHLGRAIPDALWFEAKTLRELLRGSS